MTEHLHLHQSVRPLYPVTHRITDTRGQPAQLAWHRPTHRQHARATARASPKSEGEAATRTARILGIHTPYQGRRRRCILPSEHPWSATDTAAGHSTQHDECCTTGMPLLRNGRAGQHDTGGVAALSAPWNIPCHLPRIREGCRGTTAHPRARILRRLLAQATAPLTGRSNGGGGSEGCGGPLIPLILSATNSASLLSTAMNLPPSHSCRRSGPPSLTLQRIVGGTHAWSSPR